MLALCLFLIAYIESLEVKVGVIIDPNSELKKTVDYAFNWANEEVRKNINTFNITMIPVYPEHTLRDPLHTVNAVFTMIARGVAGVIGPGDSDRVRLTSGILSSMNIPQIAPQATDPYLNSPTPATTTTVPVLLSTAHFVNCSLGIGGDLALNVCFERSWQGWQEWSFESHPPCSTSKFPYLIRLTPPDNLLNMALIDVFSHYNWSNCAMITSRNNYGEQGLRWFLLQAFREGWNILALEQHDTPEDPRTLNVTEQLDNIKNSDARVIIMFTMLKYAPYIFREAFAKKLLGEGFAWILLDATGDLEYIYEYSLPKGYPPYLKGLVTIKPVSEDGMMYTLFEEGWYLKNLKRQPFDSHYTDAVILFMQALQQMAKHGIAIDPPSTDLQREHTADTPGWSNGVKMKEYLLKQEFHGLTRLIKFKSDVEYVPCDLEYGVFNIGPDYQKKKVGSWNPYRGLNMNNKVFWMGGNEGKVYDMPRKLEGRHYKVVTIESPPFVMIEYRHGKVYYDGFLVELLKNIAEQLEFTFTLYLVEDNNWGSQSTLDGTWNGLIGDVISHKADFALGDLSVTKVRDEAVRFSKAYFRAGMALAMQLQTENKSTFYWLNPLAPSVWLAIMGVAVCCAFALFIYSKYSPMSYEAEDGEEPDEKKFSFYQCLWFMMASFMQQGPDDGSPNCLSARLIASVWWITCILIITLYTATLTANLTVSSMKKPIDMLEDLVDQDSFSYGTVGNTSYETLFRQSDNAIYDQLLKSMQWLGSIEEGYDRVKTEKFIFLWDTPLIDYQRRERNCSFERLPNEFGYSQYALAFPRNNVTMEHVARLFDKTILDFIERTYLKTLWHKWLDQAGHCAEGSRKQDENNKNISLIDLSGLFLLIGFMMLCSFIAFLCENIYYSIKDKKTKKAQPVRVEVVEEEVPTEDVGNEDKATRQTMQEAVKNRWHHIVGQVDNQLGDESLDENGQEMRPISSPTSFDMLRLANLARQRKSLLPVQDLYKLNEACPDYASCPSRRGSASVDHLQPGLGGLRTPDPSRRGSACPSVESSQPMSRRASGCQPDTI